MTTRVPPCCSGRPLLSRTTRWLRKTVEGLLEARSAGSRQRRRSSLRTPATSTPAPSPGACVAGTGGGTREPGDRRRTVPLLASRRRCRPERRRLRHAARRRRRRRRRTTVRARCRWRRRGRGRALEGAQPGGQLPFVICVLGGVAVLPLAVGRSGAGVLARTSAACGVVPRPASSSAPISATTTRPTSPRRSTSARPTRSAGSSPPPTTTLAGRPPLLVCCSLPAAASSPRGCSISATLPTCR